MARRDSLDREPQVTWNSSTGRYSLHVPDGKYGKKVMEFEPPPVNPNVSLVDQLMAEYKRSRAAAAV